MKFNELGLLESIVRAVAEEGYDVPTPIQAGAIPDILRGCDMLGCAQTGTGKTAAFALPTLHLLASGSSASPDAGKPTPEKPAKKPMRNDRSRRRKPGHPGGRVEADRQPRALVLCPTRELASQIAESFSTYGRHLPLRNAVIFGGVNQAGQVRALRRGVDILIATPGRLLDLMQQGLVDLSSVEMFILDEADRMLDMGFIRDIRKIVQQVPERRQTLLFSATMPHEIRDLADSILNDPVRLNVAPPATTVEMIEQRVCYISRPHKQAVLEELLRVDGTELSLIFTRTKHGADKVVKQLRQAGIESAAIHGNKSQNARTAALGRFKSGEVPVLIATDIASRGIDVDDITHVINFDVPHEPETYVHRIGRTARAGASGVAVTLCCHDEVGSMRAIEKLIDLKVDVLEHDLSFDPAGFSGTGGKPHRLKRAAGSANGDTTAGSKKKRSGRGRNQSRSRGQRHGRPGGSASANGSAGGGGNGRRQRPKRSRGAGKPAA